MDVINDPNSKHSQLTKVAVTTSRKAEQHLIDKALKISKELDTVYIQRGDYTVSQMIKKHNFERFLIVERDRLSLKGADSVLFWHPNMAEFKLRAISQGFENPMLKVMKLQPGFSVLDCTLGLASDAIVLSYAVGEKGKVVGIEVSKYIAYLTKNGLATYENVNDQTKISMNRIEVLNASYEEYLLNQADNTFDVVYFDPMFRTPNQKSASINSLRPFAEHRSLTKEIVLNALRVCKKRVVIKERIGSGEFERLGIKNYYGNNSPGSIAYGFIEK